jgi:hypothetical protein
MRDDTMRATVMTAVIDELTRLLDALTEAVGLDLGAAEQLWAGQVSAVVADWGRLACPGGAREVRDRQVPYFRNQARRMAYDQYRARGLDIGSGMVESDCTALIGMREKGPDIRWSVPGAEAVAQVRVLVFNDAWDAYPLAA